MSISTETNRYRSYQPKLVQEARNPIPMQTFSITDLCEEFSITRRALRFYEERGLLTPAREGPERIYNKRDCARLKLILRGKRYGFSLREIAELLDLYDTENGPTVQLQTALPKMQSQLTLLKDDHEKLATTIAELESSCHLIASILDSTNNAPTSGH